MKYYYKKWDYSLVPQLPLLDLNQCIQESKSCALPLGERALKTVIYVHLVFIQKQLIECTTVLTEMAGLEPATTWLTVKRSTNWTTFQECGWLLVTRGVSKIWTTYLFSWRLTSIMNWIGENRTHFTPSLARHKVSSTKLFKIKRCCRLSTYLQVW